MEPFVSTHRESPTPPIKHSQPVAVQERMMLSARVGLAEVVARVVAGPPMPVATQRR